jgi:hypothetical protein
MTDIITCIIFFSFTLPVYNLYKTGMLSFHKFCLISIMCVERLDIYSVYMCLSLSFIIYFYISLACMH